MSAGRLVGLAWVTCMLAGGAWAQRAGNSVPLTVPVSSPGTPAQDESAQKAPLVFDVATVKLIDEHKSTELNLRVYPGGRLVIHTHRLAMLIAEAFDVPEWEIVGGDEHIVQAWYDVEAKPSAAMRDLMPGEEYSVQGIKDARVRSMLQALLIDRFHLKYHMENKPGTIYELKHGEGPLRLKPVEVQPGTGAEDGRSTKDRSPMANNIRVYVDSPVGIYDTSMTSLARSLARVLRTPVNDETGLPGSFDFTSKTVITREDAGQDYGMHMLVEAVPEMGLKLVKAKGPVEKFVIDSVEPVAAN